MEGPRVEALCDLVVCVSSRGVVKSRICVARVFFFLVHVLLIDYIIWCWHRVKVSSTKNGRVYIKQQACSYNTAGSGGATLLP